MDARWTPKLVLVVPTDDERTDQPSVVERIALQEFRSIDAQPLSVAGYLSSKEVLDAARRFAHTELQGS
ncbi:MAG TPA: hypothetical protein VNC40_04375 [Gaiellaceae bacterium]|nr:hypothetical protein [Gaiellaceae bacterium]